MSNISPREYSPLTKDQTSLQIIADTLGIPIDINDSTIHNQLEPLPRIKLKPFSDFNEYGVFEHELTAKADKWHIPYNKDNPDFFMLENQVEEYEELIKESSILGIAWDFTVYDPSGFKQAIEEALNREYSYGRELRSRYYSSKEV